MVALMKALQVILALSILVFIHELGHFLFARLFRIRVDKFFLFFDAGGVKLFSTRQRWFVKLFPSAARWDTEYGIGWLPLGGYCKINGMIDESMDLETMRKAPSPWEFRTKPAWQRLLVMAGGVLFNFVFAIVSFTGILAVNGRSYISNDGNCIIVNELAYDMGFRDGDRILLFDDYAPEDFSMLQADLARRGVHKVTLLRGSDTLSLYMDRSMIGEVLNTPGMFSLAVPYVVDTLAEDSPNAGAGLRKGDRIVRMGGKDVKFVQDSRELLMEFAGKEVEADILRGADTVSFPLQVDTAGKIGVYMEIPGITVRNYSLIGAIPAGCKYTWDMVCGYLRDIKLVVTPSTGAYKSVGSFIAIGEVFPSSWNWLDFLNILGLLSIMLGVMNLLPIPGLDGGHIVFTLYEMITGRKPSDKFMLVAQILGMTLLLLLMLLAFGNDIGRLIR